MRWLIGALASACFLFTSEASVADRPLIDEFLKFTEVQAIAVSPSGNRIAYGQFDNEHDRFIVFDVDSGQPLFGVDGGRSRLVDLEFMHDDHLYATYDRAKFFGHWGDIGDYTTRVADLTLGDFDRGWGGAIAGAVAGTESIYTPLHSGTGTDYRGGGEGRLSLYRFNMRSEALGKSVAGGTGNTMQWFVGPDAAFFVREDFDPDKDLHQIVVIEGGKSRVLFEQATPERKIDVVGLMGRNHLVYRVGHTNTRTVTYHTMHLKSAERSEAIFSRKSGSVILNLNRQVIGFERGRFPNFEYSIVDDDLSHRFESVRASYPGAVVRLAAVSENLDHFVAAISANLDSTFYLMFSKTANKPILVAKENLKGTKSPVIQHKLLTLSQNRAETDVLLTATEKSVNNSSNPVVVLANWPGADLTSHDLSWIAQYLASAGYTVVQTSIFGSAFSGSFGPQDADEWSVKAVEQLDSAINALVDDGVIRGDRLCIVGHGVGGHTALMAAARSQLKYRCVASIDALIDIEQILSVYRQSNWVKDPAIKGLERIFGFNAKDKSSVQDSSPINHAENLDASTLLMYFQKNTKILHKHSKAMHKALQKSGKTSQLVKLDSEDIHMRSADGRRQILEELYEFLSRNLTADAT